MTRGIGGKVLPSMPKAEEEQEALDHKTHLPELKAGACPDCRGRGEFTGLCTCTSQGGRTAASKNCPACFGQGLVHTPCFTCDGSGTVAGAAEAKLRRNVQADLEAKEHIQIMNNVSRIRR